MKREQQEKTYTEWIRDYQRLVFKVSRVYSQNDEDQKDLIQEITIQIWNSIPSFQGKSSISTWIYRVALNTAFSWRNKTKRHESGRDKLDNHAYLQSDKDRDDDVEWLYHEISLLDPLEKSVCLLLLEGYAYKEIAEITGLKESNVGVKIHRIKKHLTEVSQKLKDHGV